jgi:hypothetical protein
LQLGLIAKTETIANLRVLIGFRKQIEMRKRNSGIRNSNINQNVPTWIHKTCSSLFLMQNHRNTSQVTLQLTPSGTTAQVGFWSSQWRNLNDNCHWVWMTTNGPEFDWNQLPHQVATWWQGRQWILEISSPIKLRDSQHRGVWKDNLPNKATD